MIYLDKHSKHYIPALCITWDGNNHKRTYIFQYTPIQFISIEYFCVLWDGATRFMISSQLNLKWSVKHLCMLWAEDKFTKWIKGVPMVDIIRRSSGFSWMPCFTSPSSFFFASVAIMTMMMKLPIAPTPMPRNVRSVNSAEYSKKTCSKVHNKAAKLKAHPNAVRRYHGFCVQHSYRVGPRHREE